jgi:hypothetical protein
LKDPLWLIGSAPFALDVFHLGVLIKVAAFGVSPALFYALVFLLPFDVIAPWHIVVIKFVGV